MNFHHVYKQLYCGPAGHNCIEKNITKGRQAKHRKTTKNDNGNIENHKHKRTCTCTRAPCTLENTPACACTGINIRLHLHAHAQTRKKTQGLTCGQLAVGDGGAYTECDRQLCEYVHEEHTCATNDCIFNWSSQISMQIIINKQVEQFETCTDTSFVFQFCSKINNKCK